MKKFRKTPQRLAIRKFLDGNLFHPSAEDIHDALRDQFPTLSLATVYNTLDALLERGEIVEVSGDAARKRFDPVVSRHHHLICIRCGKIVDIPEKFSPVLKDKEKRGFQVIRSQVDFHGLCPECQSRNQARKI
jgi:Fur family transcriptional regulator, peroxide stress response regulator